MPKKAPKNMNNPRKGENYLALLGFIIACNLAGAIGAIFTLDAIPNWYAALQKPFFSPPNWIFGPAWTALYILMGISAYIAWKQGKKAGFALKIFGAQLALNALWSILFFGMRSPALGFAGIVPLWLSIAYCIKLFWGIYRRAAASYEACSAFFCAQAHFQVCHPPFLWLFSSAYIRAQPFFFPQESWRSN